MTNYRVMKVKVKCSCCETPTILYHYLDKVRKKEPLKPMYCFVCRKKKVYIY